MFCSCRSGAPARWVSLVTRYLRRYGVPESWRWLAVDGVRFPNQISVVGISICLAQLQTSKIPDAFCFFVERMHTRGSE